MMVIGDDKDVKDGRWHDGKNHGRCQRTMIVTTTTMNVQDNTQSSQTTQCASLTRRETQDRRCLQGDADATTGAGGDARPLGSGDTGSRWWWHIESRARGCKLWQCRHDNTDAQNAMHRVQGLIQVG